METKEQQLQPRIIRLKEATSTNSVLHDWLANEPLPEGSVVVAEDQTAGRGQVGNHWESEPGQNLTFSLVIYPTCLQAKEQFLISQIAALSVKQTLEAYVQPIRVKWPNDVYWQDRKICGMLIENDLLGSTIATSILGIGININQAQFVSDAPNPVSLHQITGQFFDKEELLARFLSVFYTHYHSLLQGEWEAIQSAYRTALYRNDGYYSYEDATGRFEATIHTIEPSGHLLLQLRDGSIRRYAFKEVKFV